MDHLLNLVAEDILDTRTRLDLAKSCVQLFGKLGSEARLHFLPKNILANPASCNVIMPAIIRQTPKIELPMDARYARERLAFLNLGRILFLLSTNHQAPSLVTDQIYPINLDECCARAGFLRDSIHYCWNIFGENKEPNIVESVEKIFNLLNVEASSAVLEGYVPDLSFNSDVSCLIHCPAISLVRRAVTRQNTRNFMTSPIDLKSPMGFAIEDEEREFLLTILKKLDRTDFLKANGMTAVSGLFFDGTMTTINSFINSVSHIESKTVSDIEELNQEHTSKYYKPELAKEIIESLTLSKGLGDQDSECLEKEPANDVLDVLRLVLICRPFLTPYEAATNCELTPTGLRAPLIPTSNLVPGSTKICDEYNYYASTDLERSYGSMKPEPGDTILVSVFPCCLMDELIAHKSIDTVKKYRDIISTSEFVRHGGVDEIDFGPVQDVTPDDHMFLEILSQFGQSIPLCALTLGKV